MDRVRFMRPRSGKSVRYAGTGALGACGACVALPDRSADRQVDAVRWQHFLRRLQSCVEDESQPVQCGFATGVEESAVADPMEPGREGMLKEAPHELERLLFYLNG